MSFGAVPATPAPGAVAGVPAATSVAAGKPAPDGLSENEIQRTIFSHFKSRSSPGVFAFHPKNGGEHQRGRRSGINTGMGVIPGVPDVIAIRVHDDLEPTSRVYALEIKRADRAGKKPTEHEIKQAETRTAMAAAGCITGVAYGLAEAIAWLEHHGLLRGSMS